MVYKLGGREVEIEETNFIHNEGVWITAAYYVDTGEELTYDERMVLSDTYQSELYEDAVDARCDDYYDLVGDR